jgi:hypothetical protein
MLVYIAKIHKYFNMYKKTLNKINIYHHFRQYFNYLLIEFIKIKTKKT